MPMSRLWLATMAMTNLGVAATFTTYTMLTLTVQHNTRTQQHCL